ncbi:hypothetical protein BpHYR1_004121 [Brachionus plicatilis]|uniref:Uncharacterized protein n=1 Tax=Brachionus plicatilis TaxID=10195 RepID=A0A3M7R0S3_BRAPC|nr:hypothetical protein BpHYR1_004121 [Brachionus plicatilis]
MAGQILENREVAGQLSAKIKPTANRNYYLSKFWIIFIKIDDENLISFNSGLGLSLEESVETCPVCGGYFEILNVTHWLAQKKVILEITFGPVIIYKKLKKHFLNPLKSITNGLRKCFFNFFLFSKSTLHTQIFRKADFYVKSIFLVIKWRIYKIISFVIIIKDIFSKLSSLFLHHEKICGMAKDIIKIALPHNFYVVFAYLFLHSNFLKFNSVAILNGTKIFYKKYRNYKKYIKEKVFLKVKSHCLSMINRVPKLAHRRKNTFFLE